MKRFALITLLLFSFTAHAADDLPFESDPLRDGLILGSGIALEGLYYSLHFQFDIPGGAVGDRSRVNGLDRIATYGWSPKADSVSDVLNYAMLAAPVLFYFDDRVQDHPAYFLILYLESALLNDGLKNVVKELVRRDRPYTYNGRSPLSERHQRDAELSFYSGHTAQAFNAAVFCGMVFQELYPDSPWRWVVWTGGLAAATTVGFLRVYSGQHYPTDVLAGALAGSLTGWLIPFLAKKRDLPVTIVPGGAGEVGVTVSLKF